MPKYFTLDQAQQEIPKIKEQINKLMKNRKAIDLMNSIRIEFTEDYKDNLKEIDFIKISKEFHKLSYEFFLLIEDLENKGIILKDLGEGLIDFLAVFEGRDIFLCWKYGEEKIEYWHELNEGYIGRKPINIIIKK